MRTISENEDTINRLEQKWKARQSGSVKPYVTFTVGAPFLKQIGFDLPVEVPDPERLTCSFCHSKVDRVRATLGSGKPRSVTSIKIVEDIDGVKSLEEKTNHTVDKLVACPHCVDRIPKIKFPETDG